MGEGAELSVVPDLRVPVPENEMEPWHRGRAGAKAGAGAGAGARAGAQLTAPQRQLEGL